MSNALYDGAREGFLDGSIDWDTDTIKVGLVPSTYTFSAAHKFVSDLGITLNGRSAALTGRTATAGKADAADTSITATSAVSCKALAIFKDTGSDATSRLICYIDTGGGLPFTPAAFQVIPITWDNTANAIFQWVASTAPTAPVLGDIVDSGGAIVTSAYDTMYAAGVAQTDGFYDWKFGPQAASTAGGVQLFERAHTKYPDNFDQMVDPATGNHGNGGQIPSVYEYGGPPTVAGGFFSTNQATVATVQASTGCGAVEIQTSGFTNETGQLKPQYQWQNNFNPNNENIAGYITAGFLSAGDTKPAFTISAADVHADNGPSRIVCTAGGATGPKLYGVGSTTANNDVTLQLGANKLATCGTMTVMGEFAFICVWDAAARKGQIAVIICAGMPDGIPWTTTTLAYMWWYEWRLAYPGLPNRGNTAFMKLLGYVDIPGMQAPTSCHVTTGFHPWQIIVNGEGMGYPSSPIESHYTELRDGGANGGKVARGGLLAVGSMSEKKVVYFDLKNLFEWVYDSYLGTNHTRGERANLGMGDSQWPHVMSVSGITMPAVKTLTFASRVKAMRFTATEPSGIVGGRNPYHWVMTEDGVCHTINLGTNYVPGSQTGRTGTPSEIFEKSTVSGFGNVSGNLAQMMGMNQTGNVDNNSGFWFACRGTREIGYAKMNTDGTGGTIPLRWTVHSSQCTDPVGLMDTDNYSNSANSINVFDYSGRRISGYRTDILYTNGNWATWPRSTAIQPTGGVPVEFNGYLATSGKPIHGNSANVP